MLQLRTFPLFSICNNLLDRHGDEIQLDNLRMPHFILASEGCSDLLNRFA